MVKTELTYKLLMQLVIKNTNGMNRPSVVWVSKAIWESYRALVMETITDEDILAELERLWLEGEQRFVDIPLKVNELLEDDEMMVGTIYRLEHLN